MIALDILGQRERFENAFDWSDYRIEYIRTVYLGGGTEQVFYKEMIEYAKGVQREDLVDALMYASRRSNLIAPLLACADTLLRAPVLWRLGVSAKRRLLGKSIASRYIDHTVGTGTHY